MRCASCHHQLASLSLKFVDTIKKEESKKWVELKIFHTPITPKTARLGLNEEKGEGVTS